MELIYADEYYDTPVFEEGKYSRELLDELIEYDSDIKIQQCDIGHGADYPAVYVELFQSIDWGSLFKMSAIPTIFFLGKRINENIDAWIEISKKAKKLFSKKHPTRVDKNAALMILLNDLVENKEKVDNLSISLKVHAYGTEFDINKKLSEQPDALYIFDVNTPENFIIYGIKSTGEISFKHKYGQFWYDFIED